jgi:2'-hydroxyisoflavone reductase
MNLLILGGTGFIGTHQVRYALERGHEVTLFNRGQRSREMIDGVRYLLGDRDKGDYHALAGLHFDACIDNAVLVPRWVLGAAAALRGNVDHYTLISTTSVYASDAAKNADESDARESYAGIDVMSKLPADVRADMSLYGALKAASEDEAMRQFTGITAIIRPGLIVGPGDESDRFTYWPVRMATGGTDGRMLAPPREDPLQFIDVRDLAEWTVRMAESHTTGVFNAKGPDYHLTVGTMLDTVHTVSKSDVVLCEASHEFLAANEVQGWSDLPVWIAPFGDTAGSHRRSVARAVAAGLTYRPLATTVADTLIWWHSLPEARQAKLKWGLSNERERVLLSLWDQR